MIVETSSARPPVLGERNLALMLQRIQAQWGGDKDLWVFGYASLIWRPEFDFAERRPARVHGWHRALRMWSHVNRGTDECPGLVFAMLSGGSCQGMVFRIPQRDAHAALERLWVREMPTPVYDPRWLPALPNAAGAGAGLDVHPVAPQPQPHRCAAGARVPAHLQAGQWPLWQHPRLRP